MAETANTEDWKTRYRDLLSEFEQKEGTWQSLEETLRGVATRLAITAMGRDAQIDKYLSSIMDTLKGGQPKDRYSNDLEQLATAVLHHEKLISANASLDLAAFVANLNLSPGSQKRFIDQLESDSGSVRMQALNDLALELNSLLQSGSNSSQESRTSETTQQVISLMTRHMDGVPELEAAVAELNQHLQDGTSQEALNAMLENLAVAVTSIIKSIGEDKTELKAFLEQVTHQLLQFEIWAQGSSGEAQERQQDTDALERNVEQQVSGLKNDMESSNEMSQLKQQVQSRLNSIASQLKEFRKNEAQRVTEAGKRNALLLEEVNRLKLRTNELAARCNDQQERLMHDALTGVHTRYAYDRRFQEEFQRWQRHGQPLSYSIWDLDNFKKVNDTFGHRTGDRLLVVVANMLSDSTRAEDFVARIGGEEFVILFPATETDTALKLSERLREKIAGVSFHFKGTPIPVTVSCGITEFRHNDTPQSVYERADKALYQAKNDGRNRCITD